jgi:signal transduction histidine kinase
MTHIIRNVLRRLNITSRLAIAFIALSLFPFFLSGFYGIISHTRALRTIALEHLEHDVLMVRERMAIFLTGVESDMFLLGSSPLLQQVMVEAHTASQREVRREGERYLQAFMESKSIYYRIRCLDADGEELCGVEQDGESPRWTDGGERTYRLLRENGSDSRGRRYYLHLVEDLRPGEFASAPIELTAHDGKLVAALSYALPVYDTLHERIGILVADVFAKDLFRVLEEFPITRPEGKVVLVNSDGYYLYHPAKKKDWGTLLVLRDEDNLNSDYPEHVASHILSGQSGTVIEGIDEIIAYTPLFEGKRGRGGFYILFESIPDTIVFASVRSFKIFFAVSFVLILITSATLSYFAAHHFTHPINELIAGAEIIARGNYRHRLSIRTDDEIERLAEQFNVMAASIQEREQEIAKREAELERKRLEAQITQSEKLLTVGEMAAVIAHEIRNALTSVKMILQLELEVTALNESDREALTVATRSVHRMETIVNDLLKFARPSPVRFVPSDINQVIEESLALTQHQFTRKKIDRSITLDRSLPSVLLDPDQMKEVFVNLLLNAVQAIPNRGRITITTSLSPCPFNRVPPNRDSTGVSRPTTGDSYHPLVPLSPCPPEGCVEVVVADTGGGMSEEVQGRCFDPFFTTKADGTGLGLSMAKRTVEQHGGVISVESCIGEGSRFTVLLPLTVIKHTRKQKNEHKDSHRR